MWEISRRRLVSAAVWTAVGASVGVGTTRAADEQSADSWPQARHDLAGTGYTTASGAPGTEEPPGIAWQAEGTPGQYAAPIVGGGRLYLTMDSWPDGDARGGLRARDLDDGSVLWETSLTNAVGASPAYADERVYVADRRGSVYALSGDDGTELWSVDGFDMSTANPVVADDGDVYVGVTGGTMYCLDGETGSVRWSESRPGQFINVPAIADGTLYVGTVDFDGEENAVYALDADSGDGRWSVETPLGVPTVPAVRDGTLYVCSTQQTPGEGVLLALNAADGTERWRWDGLGTISSPAVGDQRVYVVEEQHVRAFGTESGLEAWFYSGSAASVSRRDPGPVVADGTVYASPGSNEGLLAFDAESGDVRWQLGALPVDTPLSVVGERVYARESDQSEERGRVWAIEEGEAGFPRPAISVSPAEPMPGDMDVIRTDEPAVLNASDSTVPGGDIEGYEWDVGDDGDVDYTGERVEHTFESDGVVEVTLTVTSGAGITASATEHVSVDGRPRLAIEVGQSEPAPGDEISFEASVTIRADRLIWEFGDGTTATGSEVTHTYAEPGEYEVRLRTGDGVDTTTTVFVSDRSDVSIEYTPPDPTAGETVTFEADGPDEAYEWEFGDGTTATGPEVTHQYEAAGEYTVTLTGAGAETQTTVSVGAGTGGEGGDGGEGADTADSGDGGRSSTDGSTGTTVGGGDGGLPVDTDSLLAVGGAGGVAALLGTYVLARRGGEDVGAQVDERLDESRRHLESARDARTDRAYEEALDACDLAETASQRALELARGDAPDRVGAVEDRVATVRTLREAVQTERDAYVRAGDGLDEVAARLDDVAASIESESESDPRERLDRLGDALDAARELVEKHGFTELTERIDGLEGRHGELLDRVERSRRRAATDAIPGTIPTTAHRSLAADDIRNEGPLGSGGNADVYRGTVDIGGGERLTLAVKEPRMSGTLHTDAVERVLEEAETWQGLDDHDHVVSVLDYGADPLPWIAMEYMDAGHLGACAGELPVEQALWVAVATTRAVRHAHRNGVAHLDLKPENIMLRSVEGAWGVPKVGDWGLSKHLLEHSKSVEGLSPQYAAPEQFDDEYGAVDDLTDVYQLGAVFYELFTGRPPFEGRPTEVMRAVIGDSVVPPTEVADLPRALDEILLRALAKRKADRYESVLYLRDDLQEIFDDRTNLG